MIRRTTGSVLPWFLVVVAVVASLHSVDVGFRDIAVFVLVQLICYSLPGMLLWRALRGRSSSWLHDITFGTILAHAVTIGVYVAGRWAGVPLAVWVVPTVTVGVFLAVPPLRVYWRSHAGEPEPAWFHWGMAFCLTVLSACFAAKVPLGMIPLAGPNLLGPAADHAFLLSLTGDLRHHMPATTPYVVDEPLQYHWFALADLAAMSWQGGQELDVLLLRLGPLWAMLNGFLAFAYLGERLAGKKAAGLLAVAIAVFVGSISLLNGAATNVVDSTLLRINWVGSPTQGFGQLLAIAVLFVAVGLLRREDTGARPWMLFVVLSLALMGSKATFIPVIGAGVALVAVVELVRYRRLQRTALSMGAILAAELVFAQVVLFGGASQGVVVDPGEDMRRLGTWIGIPAEAGTLPLIAVSAAIVFGWLAPLAGASMLLLRGQSKTDHDGLVTSRPGPGDPASQAVVAMVVSAIAVCLLLSHPGFSQYFFLRSGLPFGCLLVACGLVRLPEFVPWRAAAPALLVAAVTGGGYVVVARHLTQEQVDPHEAASRALAILGGACVIGVLAWMVGFLAARGPHRSARFALALACLSVAPLAMGAARTVDLARMVPLRDAAAAAPAAGIVRPLPSGALPAARFLRDHTDPDDMLATNAHCNRPRQPSCDIRAFWMSALSERRFVIEGWGYTATANGKATSPAESLTLPYWRPELLELNDAVFTNPTPATLAALTDRYPVRWLMVDRRFPVDLKGLAALLPEHRKFGQVTVFRVGGNTDGS